MTARRSALGLLALGSLVTLSVAMAQPKGPPSPPDVTTAVIDGNRVTVYYARPGVKDPKSGEPRKIWGGLVPYGQVWRLGANAATLMTNQTPIDLGGVTVPEGAHTLFMIPNEDGTAKLIVNKQVGQWGTQYDEKQDVGRIDLPKGKTLDKSVERLTISVGKGEGSGGMLKISWAETEYAVPFTVKK